ncbi:aldo/keto reductase [Alloscardovia macacae]|uniref:Oxidoreductase n=1 Tax=Alloscardovia macacae TaxID=1160091 RepID=A0A261F5R0_9BIFI|nr:aldo/keto reductase [Alloscardovia macacae]OZG54405.1 oxidoreductase [Alloscardovia macacae]
MERTELTPGYSISRVLNGLWQLSPGHTLSGRLDTADILHAFHELTERGMTTFDLADIYLGAEDVLGAFLRELRGSKGEGALTSDDIQIHEKYVPDYDILKTVSFADTERIIDRSLRKLGRDYIDLIQFHWWDYEVDRYIEVAQNLVKLRDKGKIRHIGVTNFDTAHLAALVDAGIPVISCQSQYSVFDRRVERAMVEYGTSLDTSSEAARGEGSAGQGEGGAGRNMGGAGRSAHIQQICYGTLAGGLLSEKYLDILRAGANVTESFVDIQPETRSQVKYLQIIDASLGADGYLRILELLNDIAREHGVQIAQVATRYILQKTGVAATIIGIRNSRHVAENARIGTLSLSADDVERIDALLAQYPTVPGEPYELERDPHSIFRSIIRMNEAEGGDREAQADGDAQNSKEGK